MNNLFNFTQTKGKRHKFPSFNLGGAKLYKNFAQKLLAVSLCIAVILLGTSVTTLAAGEVDDLVVSYDSKLNMNNLLENSMKKHVDDVDFRLYAFGVDSSCEVLYSSIINKDMFTWNSSDPAVATVTAEGVVSIKWARKTTIAVSLAGFGGQTYTLTVDSGADSF